VMSSSRFRRREIRRGIGQPQRAGDRQLRVSAKCGW
jgi:hypothetical protein